MHSRSAKWGRERERDGEDEKGGRRPSNKTDNRTRKGEERKSWTGSRGGNGLGSCAVRTQRAETCPEKAACTARRRTGTRATKSVQEPKTLKAGPRAVRGCGVVLLVSYCNFRFDRPDSLQLDPPCRRILFLNTELASILIYLKVSDYPSLLFFFLTPFSSAGG
ncbi:hypothetical protein BJX65DRAFT_130051 [Aspergillus insuetus]